LGRERPWDEFFVPETSGVIPLGLNSSHWDKFYPVGMNSSQPAIFEPKLFTRYFIILRWPDALTFCLPIMSIDSPKFGRVESFRSDLKMDTLKTTVLSNLNKTVVEELYHGVLSAVSGKSRKEAFPDGSIRVLDAVYFFLYILLENPSLKHLEEMTGLGHSSISRNFKWVLQKVNIYFCW